MHVLLLLLLFVVVILFSLRLRLLLLLLECAALKTLYKISPVVKERTRGTTKNDTNARRIVDDDIFFAPRRLFVVGVAKKETPRLVVVGQSRRPNSTQCIDVDDIDAMRTREEEEGV